MTKLVEFLVRKDGYSHEEFRERWEGDHAEIARELPGLQRYSTSVPADPDAAEYDGVLELVFESPAALNGAFESAVGREVQADAAEFVDLGAGPRMIVEETVHVDAFDHAGDERPGDG
ncbi:EthD family reductase [Natrarchaeobius sp. A-rgal3]|uniref:EthD family reductase n=1 Tax=Natrarchaeobius versutus TaxID=1679078 RepID=UPI003510A3BE